ncbi:MAG: hypothetical protein J6A06_00535 [Fibrobacteraceae bacterium]|nr:hypothetical protein [Fibrobacteraceae bacterium]
MKDEFKAKVTIAALSEDRPQGEPSSEFAVNANIVSLWKSPPFSKEEKKKFNDLEKKY